MKLAFLKGTTKSNEGPWPRRIALGLITAIILFAAFEPPIAFAFDPNEEQCLPELHFALLLRHHPTAVERNEYVFWKPSGSLSYIKQPLVLKRITGVPGDHLVIKNNLVWINDKLVSTGMALLDSKRVDPKAFERDEQIPKGFVFLTGTHPLSNDSRYWGYLNIHDIEGTGHKIF